MILSDIFDIEYGQRCYHNKSHLIKNHDNIGVPLISSSGENNGLYGFYNIESFYNNIISVANTGTICSAFYHDYECCIDDNCLVLKAKKDFTKQEMLYFSMLIQQEKYKYLYGRQVTPKRLGNTKIPNKIPDYINKIKINHPSKEILIKENVQLKSKQWKNFKCGDLFNIKLGKPVHKEQLLDGNLPYITRTANNNGVECFGDSEFINKKNAITIGAEGVVAFYQTQDFITGNKINIIAHEKLNKYNAMFICTILNHINIGRFSYGYAIVQHRLKNLTIKLPVTLEGEPDWYFMESYIKSLPYSSSL